MFESDAFYITLKRLTLFDLKLPLESDLLPLARRDRQHPMNREELKTKALKAADELLRSKGYISVVDVLLTMGKLTREDHERWRFRQVPCLEQVVRGNLAQFEFLLRTVRAYARDQLRLKPSRTVYISWGKGSRQTLRFTKSRNLRLEEMYATHYAAPELAKTKLAANRSHHEPPSDPCESDLSSPN